MDGRVLFDEGTATAPFYRLPSFYYASSLTSTVHTRIADHMLQGEVENQVLAFGDEQKGELECSIAKPGLITAPNQVLKTWGLNVLNWIVGVPVVDVKEVAAAMLERVVKGVDHNKGQDATMLNDDLVKLGRQASEK